VDDTAIVGMREGIGRLDAISDGVFEGQRRALGNGAAVDVFHCDERAALRVAHLVDRADVRVVQSGGRPRLTEDAGARFGAVGRVE
jgi:hypothetical protein